MNLKEITILGRYWFLYHREFCNGQVHLVSARIFRLSREHIDKQIYRQLQKLKLTAQDLYTNYVS